MLRAAVIAGLCVLGLIMAEVYLHTKHPKLYAFVNTLLGCASLGLYKVIFGGDISFFGAALSVILGVPGTLLRAALKFFFGA